MSRSRLYSYCIPADDGAAPNPFWGYCTLAICKPAIRRKAQKGDWIIGTGSKKFKLQGHAVYVMRVKDVLSLEEYDSWAKKHCPKKIPNKSSSDPRRRLGDAIYDFSDKRRRPVQRPSVHNKANQPTDLSGKNVLISDHFFYFGDKARKLPTSLKPIVHQHQGHKVKLSTPYLGMLINWLDSLQLRPNRLHGTPAGMTAKKSVAGCRVRARCAKLDLETRLNC